MDLRTAYNAEAKHSDWLMATPQLDVDDGLETAVQISLFSDRLANPDDALPDGSSHRRGWWGDSFADIDGDLIGSRLWLMSREKQLPSVLQRVRDYARESLRWLTEDGIARQVDVDAEFPRPGLLALIITIIRPFAAPLRYRFETFWGASNGV